MAIKKVVIACEIFPPDVGGPATFAPRLINELKNDGWQVAIITYADKTNMADDVIRVLRKWPLPLRYFIYFYKLFLLAKRADVIFCQGPMAAGLPSVIVGRLKNISVVCKVVGDTAWERAKNKGLSDLTMDEFQTGKHRGFVRFYAGVRSFVVKKCFLVITPSQYLKKIVNGWGCENNKIKVIYNSFQKKDFSKLTKAQAKEKINLTGWLLFSAARLTVWKGFSQLIATTKKLSTDYPQLKLVIAGDGPEKNNLSKAIKDSGLTDKVILTGQLNAEQMIDYFQASDGFILNSGYEGLSHVLLEALSFSLPTAASDIGGNPEVIINKQTGLLFAYNNGEQIAEAIRQLIDGRFSNNWKKAAEELLISRFAYSTMMTNYKETLKDICGF